MFRQKVSKRTSLEGEEGGKNSSNSTKREFRLLLRKKTSTTIEVTSFQNPFRVEKSTRKYIQSWPLLNSSRIVSNRREGNLEKRCGRVSCRSSCLFQQPVKTSRSVCNENVQKKIRNDFGKRTCGCITLYYCDCFCHNTCFKAEIYQSKPPRTIRWASLDVNKSDISKLAAITRVKISLKRAFSVQTDKDPCNENVWNFRQSKLIGLSRQ